MPYDQRAQLVAACRYVDHVLPEDDWEQKREDVARENIDIFAMGDDWEGKFDDLKDLCEVVYLPRTQNISTTHLKSVISDMKPGRPAKDQAASPAPSAEMPVMDAATFSAILDVAQQGKLDRKAYHRFLKQLMQAEDPKNIDWLRCWILLHCLMRKKAAKTQAYISRYSRISSRRGVAGDYADFMGLLFSDLGLQRPVNGKYSPSFASANIAEIAHKCREVEARLSGLGLRVFANSGTLLGLVREGALLAHDNDIDLGVLLNADSATKAAQEWYALCARLISDGIATHLSEWSGVTLKLQDIGGYGLDLFPAWIDREDCLFVYPHTSGNLTRDQLLPFRRDPLTGFGMPRDAEAMLASNYGEGWRVPDEGWRFPWPKARAKFEEFLIAIEASSKD